MEEVQAPADQALLSVAELQAAVATLGAEIQSTSQMAHGMSSCGFEIAGLIQSATNAYYAAYIEAHKAEPDWSAVQGHITQSRGYLSLAIATSEGSSGKSATR